MGVKRKVGRRELVRGSALAFTSISFLGCRSAKAAPPPPVAARAARRSAVDRVALGRTGLHLSRLGFGTGTASGNLLRALDRKQAVGLMRYAFERGINFIDTADMYRTHDLVREAMAGLPRERFFVMTKLPRVPENPLAELDRYRRELATDYVDLLLVHCARTPTWDDDRKRVVDAVLEAQHRQIIRARGVSCHGLPALRRSTAVAFPEVHLVRYNPTGASMDGDWQRDLDQPGDVAAVTAELRKVRAQGRGVLGMKIMGEGRYKTPEERERSIQFVVRSGLVDAMTIGFLDTRQVDEAIERIDRALAPA
jgi:hypothetical protein